MTEFYKKYADWMRELQRIAQRHIERSCRTWVAYCAGMSPAMYAAKMLGL